MDLCLGGYIRICHSPFHSWEKLRRFGFSLFLGVSTKWSTAVISSRMVKLQHELLFAKRIQNED